LSLESRRAHLSDPGAEWLESVTSFWDRNQRVVLGSAAVLLVIAAGTFFTLRSRATQDEAASGRLAEADLFFWQGDYPRAQQVAKEVAQQYGSTPSGLDAHRLTGDAAYWAGDFKTAAEEYQTYLARQKSGVLANAARRSLAYTYESGGQLAKAVPIYDQLVGVFDRESSAEFLMAAARCEAGLHQNAEAIKRLQRLGDEFGDTSLAGRAREMMGELQAR
jgi:tetratricopeptide (TPR) repeat protein